MGTTRARDARTWTPPGVEGCRRERGRGEQASFVVSSRFARAGDAVNEIIYLFILFSLFGFIS